jgi:hypothetical protein
MLPELVLMLVVRSLGVGLLASGFVCVALVLIVALSLR